MDTESLVARCGQRDEDDLDAVTLDVPRLLTRLLLFDTYVLECSLRLRDLMELARAIGTENTCLLLGDGGLRLSTDTTSIGYPTTSTGDTVKDPMNFSFVIVQVADPEAHLRSSIREVERMPDFKHRKLSKLVQAASRAIVTPATGQGLGRVALETLESELSSASPILRAAIDAELRDRGLGVPGEYRFEVHRDDNGSWFVGTDLEARLGLSVQDRRDLFGRALVGVGGLDLRLEQMSAYGSITAFNDADYALMDQKLAALISQISEDDRTEQLRRVVELTGLPSLEDVPLKSINFDKFVSLRDSPHMRDFRQWLHGAASASDEEILDRAKDLSERVVDALQGRVARGARLALTTGVGFIPGVGTLAGLGLSARDEFALKRLLGEVGPLAFFVRHYPSVFEGR